MSPDEIYKLSLEVQTILKNPAFIKTVDLLRQSFTHDIMSSRPEEKAVREKAYMQAKALEELLTSFETITVAALRFEASADDEE